MHSKTSSSLPLVLFVPHWRNGGGAGFYTQDLISGLHSAASVVIGGVYAKCYRGKSIQNNLVSQLGGLTIPIYHGVRLRATLWYLTVAMLRLVRLFLVNPINANNSYLKRVDLVILTSSVQSLAILVLRRISPKCKIVIVIQENVVLNKGLGHFMLKLLRLADGVISISRTWSEHAKDVGLSTTLLRNGYDKTYITTAEQPTSNQLSDILYLGGGSRIKGFHTFLRVLPRLAKRPGLRIICLGTYDAKARKDIQHAVDKINFDFALNIVDLVSDVRPYLIGAHLLLLPIENAHFCRPAIEAGFFKKTFLITRLTGLDDFAVENLNCLAFESNNIDELESKINTLLNDEKLRLRLANQNNTISQQFVRSDRQIVSLFHSLLPSLFVKRL